jgi:hypothetical protein
LTELTELTEWPKGRVGCFRSGLVCLFPFIKIPFIPFIPLIPSKFSGSVGQDAGFVEEVDDFSGEALEFVVEVVGEMVDALVGAFDAGADFAEMLRLLVADLVEFRAELPEQFLEFLFERGAALEVVDDFEEDEEDGGERGGVDEPGGKMGRVGRRNFVGEDGHEQESERVSI